MVANGIDEIASLPNSRTFSRNSSTQSRIVCNINVTQRRCRVQAILFSKRPPRQFNWRQSVMASASGIMVASSIVLPTKLSFAGQHCPEPMAEQDESTFR